MEIPRFIENNKLSLSGNGKLHYGIKPIIYKNNIIYITRDNCTRVYLMNLKSGTPKVIKTYQGYIYEMNIIKNELIIRYVINTGYSCGQGSHCYKKYECINLDTNKMIELKGFKLLKKYNIMDKSCTVETADDKTRKFNNRYIRFLHNLDSNLQLYHYNCNGLLVKPYIVYYIKEDIYTHFELNIKIPGLITYNNNKLYVNNKGCVDIYEYNKQQIKSIKDLPLIGKLLLSHNENIQTIDVQDNKIICVGYSYVYIFNVKLEDVSKKEDNIDIKYTKEYIQELEKQLAEQYYLIKQLQAK
ncbi:MAG: hypothetical protein OXR84_15630 [Magnetovibrio sp.]|nr:hypothetical protein [Magnetovibrio sp.]